MPIYSHRDKNYKQLLVEHLKGTYEWGMHFLNITPNKVIENVPEHILKSCLLLHDIGKATQFFQDYLEGKKTEEELKSHSLFSSVLFLYGLIKHGLKKEEEIHAISAFMAISRHHSNLTGINAILKVDLENQNEILSAQWDSVTKDNTLLNILKDIGINEDIANNITSASSICEIIDDVKCFLAKMRRDFNREFRRIKTEQNLYKYFLIENIFSLLTDSDKSQIVLRNTDLVGRMDLCGVDVSGYMAEEGIGTNDTFLNRLRQEAFKEIDSKIYEVDIEKDRILELTLPTGLGKTLASLNFAFGLRKRLKKMKDGDYRVIYVLPFLSVIDQNSGILENIIKKFHPDALNALIKHHHLQPISWDVNENERKINYNMAEILVEGWNGEVIATSFVQFFETLIGFSNRRQRKFCKLSRSIVIIDEIQALPVKYYDLVRKVLIDYAKLSDSYVIAMTATQPRIFANDEIKPLCRSEKYFEKLNRIQLVNRLNSLETIQSFVGGLSLENDKKYLFILNTIQSARKLFKAIIEKFPDRKSGFISAHVIPVERLTRINDIKSGKYDLIVSTQVVEAGVDIDFDVVYRDLAPLPAIIQSAGRANREGMRNGMVIAIKLIGESGRSYASSTYRQSQVDIDYTQKILKQEIFSEIELFSAVNDYYNIICSKEVKSQEDSFKILKGMALGEFSERQDDDIMPVSSFRIIDDDIESVPVFVEMDNNAVDLWRDYESILTSEKFERWEKKYKLDDLLRKMSGYIINISKNHLENVNKPPPIHGFLYISMNQLANYYDSLTGFGKDSVLGY